MDFVPLSSSGDGSYVFGFIGLAMIVFSLLILCLSAPLKLKSGATTVLAFLSIALTLGSFITSFVFFNINLDEKKDRRAFIENSLNEVYSLDLNSTEVFNKLRYPDFEPKSDFERYGTLTESSLVDDKLVETSVTLVWADGEMRLYGLDENKEVGSELPRVDEVQE